MIERSLNIYGVALFGVVVTLFLALFPPQPIICNFRPSVHLPWATTATPIEGLDTDLEITVRSDRRIYVGVNLVPAAQLESELRRLASYGPGRQILVSADGDVSYAAVEHVLVAARAADFERLSLMTFRGTRLEAWERGADV
jgi:biopolymer transport protein ExbD